MSKIIDNINDIETIVSKQDTLVSGTNIKTINGDSVLGGGNMLVGATIDYQEFTTSGTWTKPSGCNYVYVEAWGGGGSGRRTTGAVTGGGGGAYNAKILKNSDVASSVPITIGSGGQGVSTVNGGNSGGDTTFGSLVIARGGVRAGGSGNNNYGFGGSGAASGQTTSIHSTGDYSSGAGGGPHRTNGADSVKGGAGGGGHDGGSNAGLGGKSLDGGNGGNASLTVSGSNGSFPSGGGGSSKSATGTDIGGNGGNGLVRVWCW